MKKKYLKSYLNQIIDFKKYYYFLTHRENKKFIGIDGFYSLDHKRRDSGGKFGDKRINDFLEDTIILNDRIKSSLEIKEDLDQYLNKTHLNELKEIIRKSEEKGISVIFIIPPRLKDYSEIHILKKYLPQGTIIDISNAKKYPELYMTDYTFDIGHLNDKGAEFFTKYITEEFTKNRNF